MSPRLRPALILAAAALLALAGWAAKTGSELAPLNLRGALTSLPRSLGPWLAFGQEPRLDQRTLDLLKPQDYLVRTYLDNQGRTCALFVAFFGTQQEGQMIHSPRQCLPGSGWRIISRREVEVQGPVERWRVNHLVLGLNLDRLSVLYWYQGRGRVEPNEYRDRLRLIGDAIQHQRNDGALVRLTAELKPTGPDLTPELLAMAAELIPALDRLLPAPPGGLKP